MCLGTIFTLPFHGHFTLALAVLERKTRRQGLQSSLIILLASPVILTGCSLWQTEATTLFVACKQRMAGPLHLLATVALAVLMDLVLQLLFLHPSLSPLTFSVTCFVMTPVTTFARLTLLAPFRHSCLWLAMSQEWRLLQVAPSLLRSTIRFT